MAAVFVVVLVRKHFKFKSAPAGAWLQLVVKRYELPPLPLLPLMLAHHQPSSPA